MNTIRPQEKGLIAWFASNHVAANLLMLVILGAGLMSATSIRKQTLPDFNVDTIEIIVPYLGAAPQEVEEGVVVKIEEAVQNIKGIDTLRSASVEGTGRVYLEILPDENIDDILNEVKVRVDSISTFPELTEKPVIRKQEYLMQVLLIAVYGDIDERSRKLLTRQLGDELLELEEVSEVAYFGDREFEISIEVSEQDLRKYNLTMSDVSQAIRNSSVDLPGGTINTSGGDVLLRTKGQAYSGIDFGRIVLRSFSDGTRLTLSDVAEITDGFVEDEYIARFDGKPASSIRIMTSDRINELETSRVVRQFVERKQAELPEDVMLDVWGDRSPYLLERLNMMLENLFWGALLVFLMLALFLRAKVAGWVVVGIPVTFMGALWLMPFMPTPVSINMLSLFGFIMVLGIVVDDAIIIGESIYTQIREEGHSVDSVIRGAQKVAVPATFGVLTTVAAFAPLMLIDGHASSFIFPMAAVVILCLLFSLVESKLILPAHLAATKIDDVDEDDLFHPQREIPLRERLPRFFLKINRRTQHGLHRFIDNVYRPTLRKAIQYRGISFTAFVGILIIGGGLIAGGHVRVVIFPEVAGETIRMNVEMKDGTSRESRDATILAIEDALTELNERYNAANPDEPPYVRSIATYGTGKSSAVLITETPRGVERDFDGYDIIDAWRETMGELPSIRDISFSFGWPLGGGVPISFQLNGDNIEKLEAAARELEIKLAEYDNVFDIVNSSATGTQEIRLRVKPEAEALGLTMANVGRQVRQAFYGEEAQRIQRGKNEVKVMVRYPENERRSVADLRNMFIRTPSGDEVPFSSVADLDFGNSYSAIVRLNRVRTVTVSADADLSRVEPGKIIADIQQSFIPDLLRRYPGIKVELQGAAQEEEEFQIEALFSFIASLFIIYALIAIPLKSYAQPLIIMAVIPFGAIGALFGHYVLGLALSMFSIYGLVVLAGIVVNDSLIMVDFINRGRERGMPMIEAVIESGCQRFRAIVLTSVTTAVGLLPIVLETSAQAQFLIPMAVSVSFGIIFATVITLYLVPCLYLMQQGFLQNMARFRDFLFGRQPVGDAS